MDDFISREAAIRSAFKLCRNTDYPFIDDIQNAIEEIPAADVRPVVRGEWEPPTELIPVAYDIAGVITWASEMHCSKCGFSTKAIEGRISQYNFCPSCGSDMRPRDDDKTGIRKEQGPDGPI